jgi:surface antigen
MFEGMTGGLPPDHPAAVFARSFNSEILTPEARRLLSPRGRTLHVAAAAQTLDTGTTTSWINPADGEAGSMEPLGEFTNSQGHKCQRVRSTVTVRQEQAEEVTTYCRRADGSRYALG